MRHRLIAPLTARSRVVVALVSLVLMVACEGLGPLDGSVSADLKRARTRWAAAGLQNYSFVSRSDCFCPTEFLGPLTVVVRNGAVTAITSTASGEPRPLTYRQPIDSLFPFIERQAAELPARLRVTYNPTLGFPTEIAYGTPENDGGGVIRILSLTPAP
jgi:hypothetical protein